MKTTPRGYKSPEGTDRVLRQDIVDMMDAIDADNQEQEKALKDHKTAATLDHPDDSVTDAKIGKRTITDTLAAATSADTITRLFSKLAYMIKSITGKTNWYTLPEITLEAINTLFGTNGHAHTGVKGDGPKISAENVTSKATGNIAATNVQAAIEELEAEKLPYDSTVNNVRVIRDAGQYSNNNVVTGAIKITIPATITNNMMFRMRLEGYVYNAAKDGWTLNIESHTTAKGTLWHAPKALLTPNSPTDTVRFGFDGTSLCILLGTTSTVWAYPKMYIAEVMVGYLGMSSFPSKLDISLITDETGITFTAGTVKILAATDSPTLTGTPTVPTAAVGTNTMQAASTAFVQAAITPANLGFTSWGDADNGGRKFPDGLIMQWVTFASSNSPSGITVNFPVAFPTACVSAFLGLTPSTGNNIEYAQILALSTSGFTVVTYSNVSGKTADTIGNPRVFAIGY